MSKDSNQHIQVYVRCRPLNNIEIKSCSSSVVDVTRGKDVTVRERLGDKEFSKKFSFDTVFGPDSTQIDVYNKVARPCIQEVLLGYNCTIFAYGQTGTGKTHTMQGVRSDEKFSWEEDPESGVIPRTLHHLFDELQQNYAEYTVRVSFLELYNEELKDLLNSTDGTKLKLFEDNTRKGAVIIQGLSELTVTSKDEVYSIMELGANKRVTASTAMNEKSSRSHTIFSVTVHIKECTPDGEDLLKIGKLNLVDLAGSECIGRSGAVDRRAREAGSINQSLLTLGRVITALVEKTPHIPYRESKLTRLLQDSLGGRTKTSIVATISPAACNLEETLSTLDYAHRAKNITNKPEINQKMTKKMLIREYTEEIARLRRDLIATAEKNGIVLTEETYNFIQNKLVFQEEDLKQKQANIEVISEELERLKELFDATHVELTTKDLELKEHQQKLEETSAQLEDTLKALTNTTVECEMQRHLVQCQIKTEQLLTNQSLKLMEVAGESTVDVDRLHDKLARKSQVESANSQVSENFLYQFQKNFQQLEDCVSEFVVNQEQRVNSLITAFGETESLRHSESYALLQIAERFASSHHQQLICHAKRWSLEKKSRKSWAHQTRRDTRKATETTIQSEKVFVEDKLGPMITAASSLLKGRNTLVTDLEQMVEEKLAKWNESKNQHIIELENILARHHLHLKPLLAANLEEFESCHIGTNIFHSSQKEINLVLEEMKTGVEKFTSFMAGIQLRLEQTRPQADSAVTRIIKSLGNVEATNKMLPGVIDQHLSGIEQTVDAFAQSAASSADHLLETARLNAEEGKDLHLKMQMRLDNIKQETLSYSNTVVQNAQTFHSTTAALTSYKEGRVQYLNEKKGNLEQLSAMVEAADKEYKCAFGEQEHEGPLTLQKSLVESINSSTRELQETVGMSIHVQDETVARFLHEELQEDFSTGLTPLRRDYPYCQDLAATSPHERIMQRFRETSADEIIQKLTFPEVPAELAAAAAENMEEVEPSAASFRQPSIQDLSSDTESKENLLRKTQKSKAKNVPTEHSSCRNRKPLAPPNFQP